MLTLTILVLVLICLVIIDITLALYLLGINRKIVKVKGVEPEMEDVYEQCYDGYPEAISETLPDNLLKNVRAGITKLMKRESK